MPPSHRTKIRSTILVISVAIIALVFGVMLDDRVLPESKKPLMTEEAEEHDKKTASVSAEIEQTIQERAAKRRKEESAQMEQLDQKAEETIEKADGIISKTDGVIAKAGLPEPISAKKSPPQNQKIIERLAKARERLDALKSKK